MKSPKKHHHFFARRQSLAATALVMALVSPELRADSISYNFSENAGNQQLDTVTPKGPRGTSFWNDSNAEGAGASGSESDLVDDSGNPTNAAITWSSTNTWYNGSGTGSEDARILVGYLDDGAPGVNVTLTDIPYAKYNVYGIVGSDQGAEYTTGDFSVNGQWTFETVLQQIQNEGSLGAAANSVVMTGGFLETGALAGADQPSFQTTPGQIIKVPYNAALNPAGAFTVEAWLKPAVTHAPGSGTVTSALACGNFAEPRSGWLIYQSETGWNFRTYNQNGLNTAVNITGGPVPEAGNWYHVVAVWDGSVGKLYVNGSLVATSTETTYVPGVNGDFHLGSRSDGAFGWDGALDEVAFYNGALPDATIASHHANGTDAGRTTPYDTLVQASTPVGYWRGAQLPVAGPGTAPAFGSWGAAGQQWIRINPATDQRGNYWRINGVTGSTCVIQGQPRAGATRSSLTAVIIEEAVTPDRLIQVGDESYDEVALGAGLTSEFRPGTDTATVTGSDGFSVAPTHQIAIVPQPGVASGTYPLITYQGTIGGGGFGALALAPSANSRYGLDLIDNAANGSIDLQYTAPDPVLWTAANGSAWDTGSTQNWKTETGGTPTAFLPFDVVKFDDTAASGTIVIDAAVSPVSMEFDNDTVAYSISGAPIGGATGLLKTNFGTVSLLNDNTFTGAIVIDDGKLIVGDGTTGSLAAAAPVEVGGAAELEINLPDDATLANPIANAGATTLSGEGSLTVSGKITGGGLLSIARDGAVTMSNNGHLGEIIVSTGSTLNASGGAWGASFFGNGNRKITVESQAGITTGVHSLGGLGAALNQPSILLEEDAVWTLNGEQYLSASNLLLEGGVVSISVNDLRLQEGTLIAYPSAPGSLISGGAVTLYGDVSFDVADGDAEEDLVIQSPIGESEAGRSLTKLGSGVLRVASTLNSGRTNVTEGTLSLISPGLSDASTLDVAGGATLELDFTGEDHVAAFEIDGVAQETGRWGRPGSIVDLGADHESPRISGDGLLAVGIADPFDDWITTHFPDLTGDDALPGADPDGDGLDNFTEFALDGDPTSGIASGKVRTRIETVGDRQALVITFPVRGTAVEVGFAGAPAPTATVDGVTYAVQGSNDLGGFDQTVTELSAPMADSMPALGDGWHYRSFRLSGDIPDRGAKGFLRVVVE